MKTKKPPEERFWAKVNKTDGCWLWTGALEHRYGSFKIAGRARRAHRYAWEITSGPIPSGAVVCHSCDTPACVNPSHLWLGTQADNLRDMGEKGRRGNGQGEGHARAKLTEADVRQIRGLRERGAKLLDIARRFHINQRTVGAVVSGKSWKHIA